MTAERPRTSRPTIQDVAQLAGVSSGTVSRVINGARNMRPALVTAVNNAIEELGYSVNLAARNLAVGRTGSVAFVISERPEHLFQDPNFGVYVNVFSRQLRGTGQHLQVTTAQDTEEEALVADYLTTGHVDGVLLIALPHGHETLPKRLLTKRVPTVILGKPVHDPENFSWVTIDNRKAARQSVRYLMDTGRTSIATVAGPLYTSTGQERLAGYRTALGKAFRPELVAEGDWSLASGRLAAGQLLERCPSLDALFVASDLMAVGALDALRDARRRVPEDVSVVGFDDSAAAMMADPALTTMRNPFEQIAIEALRILDALMTRSEKDPVHVVLATEFVVRGSS